MPAQKGKDLLLKAADAGHLKIEHKAGRMLPSRWTHREEFFRRGESPFCESGLPGHPGQTTAYRRFVVHDEDGQLLPQVIHFLPPRREA